MAASPHGLQQSVQWVSNPLARAAVLFVTGIISILISSYFLTRDWH